MAPKTFSHISYEMALAKLEIQLQVFEAVSLIEQLEQERICWARLGARCHRVTL